MTTKKRVLNSVKHFLLSFIFIIKGFIKLDHHSLIGSILLLFGIIVFGFFIYSLRQREPNEKFILAAHWFEAIAALFMAYIYFTEGATYLPYVFLLAALGFFISIFMHHKKAHAH